MSFYMFFGKHHPAIKIIGRWNRSCARYFLWDGQPILISSIGVAHFSITVIEFLIRTRWGWRTDRILCCIRFPFMLPVFLLSVTYHPPNNILLATNYIYTQILMLRNDSYFLCRNSTDVGVFFFQPKEGCIAKTGNADQTILVCYVGKRCQPQVIRHRGQGSRKAAGHIKKTVRGR